MSYKIKQEHEKCIGCGTCCALCPENWEMRDDGKAWPKKTELNDVGCNQQAADSCPVLCIHIIKTKLKAQN
jgi:ferredoxin